jgi:integrase
MVARKAAPLTERKIREAIPGLRRYELTDGTMPGLCVRVNTGGTKTYMVRYGRAKAVTLGDCAALTLAQARDMARGILHQACMGIDPAQERRRARSTEFVAYVREIYAPHAAALIRHAEASIKHLLSIWEPVFGGRPITDITLAAVERFRGRRLLDGVAPATCNRDVARLRAVLSLAVRYGDLPAHPLHGLRILKVDNTRVRFLSPQEEEALRRALDERQEEMREKRDSFNAWRVARRLPALPGKQLAFTDWLKPLVLLAMNTGMRRGELFKLTWTDVELAEGLITVQPSSAKSGKRRHIPLSDEAAWVLSALQKQAHGTYVFHDRGKPLATATTAWENLLERAGVANFRFHDLRHHFASRLVQAGADLNTVRELLGHGDLKMTLRYAHLAPHNRRRVVDLLNKPREVAGNVVNFPHQ